MNLKEQEMWREIRPKLEQFKYAKFRRIENGSMARGMSDIAFTIGWQPNLKPPIKVRGWIELKYLRSRAVGTSYDLEHFTGAQREFLLDEQTMAGNAWLLIKTDTMDWYLVRGDQAAELDSIPLHKDLKAKSHGHWSCKLDYDEFYEILLQRG